MTGRHRRGLLCVGDEEYASICHQKKTEYRLLLHHLQKFKITHQMDAFESVNRSRARGHVKDGTSGFHLTIRLLPTIYHGGFLVKAPEALTAANFAEGL